MKRLAFLVVLSALVATVAMTTGLPCCSASSSAYAAEGPATATTRLHVEGMTCGACATSVKLLLGKIDGVSGTRVSLEEKSAVVTHDPAKVTPQHLADTINAKLPYKATVVTKEEAKK